MGATTLALLLFGKLRGWVTPNLPILTPHSIIRNSLLVTKKKQKKRLPHSSKKGQWTLTFVEFLFKREEQKYWGENEFLLLYFRNQCSTQIATQKADDTNWQIQFAIGFYTVCQGFRSAINLASLVLQQSDNRPIKKQLLVCCSREYLVSLGS